MSVSPARKTVVIGFLGTVLDRGRGRDRWDKWRPTVDLCRHDDLVVHRFELLRLRDGAKLAASIQEDLAAVSPETEVNVRHLPILDPWDFEEVYGALHDFARAYPFDPDREDYLVHITTGTHVAQICLFLLAESRHLPARLVQTSPVRAKRKDGPGTYSIIDLDLSRYDRLASRFATERAESVDFLKSGIDTKNEAFNQLIERIERVVIASDAPLLLMGPTGAGKSRLARRIYELAHSRGQVHGPFVEVNCATLRGDAAMSALFGHIRGAFTGAQSARKGLLGTADGGILFLDEIGELGLDEQAMLLRAVEEKTFLPVGSDTEASSNFRLIAGTNRDLKAAIRDGRFREDLHARIDLWTFRLPGLAERPEDIEPNLDFELDRFTERHGRRVTLNKEARARFLDYATSPRARWSGNFRTLNAAVTRMGTLTRSGRIDEAEVAEELERLEAAEAGPPPDDQILARVYPEGVPQLDRFDRVQLEEVVRVCARAGSLSEAGRTLFSVSREKKRSANDADRLRKYLARFELTWADVHRIAD